MTIYEGGIDPPVLTLALDGGEWSASCPWHFTLRETARYSMYRRLGGSQNQSGHYEEEKNLLPLLGIKL
jgi:hypothetical protein